MNAESEQKSAVLIIDDDPAEFRQAALACKAPRPKRARISHCPKRTIFVETCRYLECGRGFASRRSIVVAVKHLLLFLAVLSLCSDAGGVEIPRTPESSVPADEPMRFVVVRSSQAGCEPKCAEWISAEGAIVLSTAEGCGHLFWRCGAYPLGSSCRAHLGQERRNAHCGNNRRSAWLELALGDYLEGPHAVYDQGKRRH
jgi:hypothetical protein